jgi:hypothetical protein
MCRTINFDYEVSSRNYPYNFLFCILPDSSIDWITTYVNVHKEENTLMSIIPYKMI